MACIFVICQGRIIRITVEFIPDSIKSCGIFLTLHILIFENKVNIVECALITWDHFEGVLAEVLELDQMDMDWVHYSRQIN